VLQERKRIKVCLTTIFHGDSIQLGYFYFLVKQCDLFLWVKISYFKGGVRSTPPFPFCKNDSQIARCWSK